MSTQDLGSGIKIYYKVSEGSTSTYWSSVTASFRASYNVTHSNSSYTCSSVDFQIKLDRAISTAVGTPQVTIGTNPSTAPWNIFVSSTGKTLYPAAYVLNLRNYGTGWSTFTTQSINAKISGDFASSSVAWNICTINNLFTYGYTSSGTSATKGYKMIVNSTSLFENITSDRIKLTFNANGGYGAPGEITTLKEKTVAWPGSSSHDPVQRSFNINFYKNDPTTSADSLVYSSPISVTEPLTFDYWKSQQTDYHWHESAESFSRSHDFIAKYDTDTQSSTCTCPSYPSIFGYTCLGWYTSRTGGSQVGGNGGSSLIEFSDSANLYAHWDPVGHTATIKYFAKLKDEIIPTFDDDGKGEMVINTKYGITYSAKLPDIWGHNTPSYVLAPDDSQVALDNITGNEDIVYAAIYEPKLNTIVFNSNRDNVKIDGISRTSITYSYTINDGIIDEDIHPSKKSINIFGLYDMTCQIGSTLYCFLGWNTKKDGSGDYVTYLIPSDKKSVPSWGGTTQYYAQWLPLGRYVYMDSRWHGVLNAWVYTKGKWQGWIPGVADSDLIKSNTTAWILTKDEKTGSLVWKKEYGGNRIS